MTVSVPPSSHRQQHQSTPWRQIGDWPTWIHTTHTPAGHVWNTIAVSLRNDGIMVTNPDPGLTNEDHLALLQIGKPRFVVATTTNHYRGIEKFCQRHEGVLTVCSQPALSWYARTVPVPFTSPTALEDHLRKGTILLPVDGVRTGETWIEIQHNGAHSWIVPDAFSNVLSHPPLPFGIVTRLLRMAGGLRLSRTFRWFSISDRATFKKWFERQATRTTPRMLVPARGEPLSDMDLTRRLLALVHTYI